MQAFVEFVHETSYMESSSPYRIQNLNKYVTLRACCHFHGLFCNNALTLEVEKCAKNAV